MIGNHNTGDGVRSGTDSFKDGIRKVWVSTASLSDDQAATYGLNQGGTCQVGCTDFEIGYTDMDDFATASEKPMGDFGFTLGGSSGVSTGEGTRFSSSKGF